MVVASVLVAVGLAVSIVGARVVTGVPSVGLIVGDVVGLEVDRT